MALAHNGMIRGLNSIYLQAVHLPPSDTSTIRDFLTYCQCSYESMHHHHDIEEEHFFPQIEKIASVPGLMQANVEQHQAFTPGFEAFDAFVRTCQPENYDGTRIKELVDAFATTLHRVEIETTGALVGTIVREYV